MAKLWPGLTLAAIGAAPTVLTTVASLASHMIKGCSANESGAIGCALAGYDLNTLFAKPFALLPLAPVGFVVMIAGLLWALMSWSQNRASARRAKHR